MRRRVRRQSYVDRDLNQRARAHATANRVTDSSVTEAALIKYLDAPVPLNGIARTRNTVSSSMLGSRVSARAVGSTTGALPGSPRQPSRKGCSCGENSCP